MRPSWTALATRELPSDERASARVDILCDQITGLLYRAHRLANAMDPTLADYLAARMTQAFRIQ